MRRSRFFALGLLVIVAAGLFVAPLAAQNSRTVFVDGWVDLKTRSGETYELFIGDQVVVGDSVITGADGTAELEPQAGSRIIIQPNTVFAIQERNVGGQNKSALSCTLGQVAFVFNRMGSEPDIMTPSAVCGVRGTEFTVYAGADGSTMIIVDSGAVEVASQGVSVALNPQEGVEIRAGQKPEKFIALQGEIDFPSWNEQRIEAMMGDPISTLLNLEKQLDELIADTREFWGLYEENRRIFYEKMPVYEELTKGTQPDKAISYMEETMRPIQDLVIGYGLNYRYYAVTALSLRRHVFAGLYVRMKTQYIADPGNPQYRSFLEAYDRIMVKFENQIVPYLIDRDI